MGWEKRERGRQLYFTRSKRLGDRVIREYLGTGGFAQLAAERDALRRLQREVSPHTGQRACEPRTPPLMVSRSPSNERASTCSRSGIVKLPL